MFVCVQCLMTPPPLLRYTVNGCLTPASMLTMNSRTSSGAGRVGGSRTLCCTALWEKHYQVTDHVTNTQYLFLWCHVRWRSHDRYLLVASLVITADSFLSWIYCWELHRSVFKYLFLFPSRDQHSDLSLSTQCLCSFTTPFLIIYVCTHTHTHLYKYCALDLFPWVFPHPTSIQYSPIECSRSCLWRQGFEAQREVAYGDKALKHNVVLLW